jgi:predicted Zn finger-like uncharacterized protein
MSQLVACPECGKQLQVPDDLLGKNVQCPECKHTFTAALPVEDEKLSTGTTSSLPVSTKRSDRGSARDELHDEDDDDFRVRRSRRGRHSGGDFVPHRGGLILAFGIIGLVSGLGFIFGPIAWFMGNADLREISEGRMDPEGEGMTQAGRIMGMIATIFSIVGIVIGCGFGLLWLFCFGAIIAGGAAAQKNQQFPGPPMRKGF